MKDKKKSKGMKPPSPHGVPIDAGNISHVASQSSVDITRNAKGVIQFSVKVYDFDPEVARKKAEETYRKLAKALPFSD